MDSSGASPAQNDKKWETPPKDSRLRKNDDVIGEE